MCFKGAHMHSSSVIGRTIPTCSVLLGTLLLLIGCDKGVGPKSQENGGGTTGNGTFTGLITYRNWPTPDSLKDLRLVAFQVFPPRDIVSEVLAGRAVVYPPLGDTALVPFFVDTLSYSVTAPAGTYAYVVVAQRYGPNVLADWRPVGQYDLDTNLAVPSPVVVTASQTTRDINISVDFVNRPPPPP